MKKSLLSISLIITLLATTMFLLAGCGKEDEDKDSSKKKADTEQNETKKEDNKEIEIGAKGYFAKYKDNIYYWKIDKNSREESALYGNLNDSVDSKNKLIRIDKNGNEETIIEEKGSRELFISNDRIFYGQTTQGYNSGRKIYSIDLNGKDKKECASGEMMYLIGDYIYCNTESVDNNIFSINTKTGDIKDIVKSARIDGCIDDTVFYTKNDAIKKLDIGTISENTDNGIITTFNPSKFEMYQAQGLEIANLWKENEKINIYVSYRDGSAAMLQEVCKITMDKDGKNVEQTIVENSDDYVNISNSREYGAVVMKYIPGKGAEDYIYKLVYNDAKTGAERETITLDDINKNFDFSKDDEHITSLYKANVIDDDIYAIFDYEEHEPAGDIGWRYAYKRVKTVCFKYNILSGKFTTLYEF